MTFNNAFIEILFFFLICLILVFILLFLATVLSPKNPTNEKASVYECGFEPFSEARINFDIHFYIVAILFIIFDIEVIFLIPWILSLSSIGLWGVVYMFLFLYFFLIGFILEYKLGIIDWVQ